MHAGQLTDRCLLSSRCKDSIALSRQPILAPHRPRLHQMSRPRCVTARYDLEFLAPAQRTSLSVHLLTRASRLCCWNTCKEPTHCRHCQTCLLPCRAELDFVAGVAVGYDAAGATAWMFWEQLASKSLSVDQRQNLARTLNKLNRGPPPDNAIRDVRHCHQYTFLWPMRLKFQSLSFCCYISHLGVIGPKGELRYVIPQTGLCPEIKAVSVSVTAEAHNSLVRPPAIRADVRGLCSGLKGYNVQPADRARAARCTRAKLILLSIKDQGRPDSGCVPHRRSDQPNAC